MIAAGSVTAKSEQLVDNMTRPRKRPVRVNKQPVASANA